MKRVFYQARNLWESCLQICTTFPNSALSNYVNNYFTYIIIPIIIYKFHN